MFDLFANDVSILIVELILAILFFILRQIQFKDVLLTAFVNIITESIVFGVCVLLSGISGILCILVGLSLIAVEGYIYDRFTNMSTLKAYIYAGVLNLSSLLLLTPVLNLLFY